MQFSVSTSLGGYERLAVEFDSSEMGSDLFPYTDSTKSIAPIECIYGAIPGKCYFIRKTSTNYPIIFLDEAIINN